MSAPHLLHVFPTFAPGGAQVRTVGLMGALAGELRHSVVPLDGRIDASDLVGGDVELELLPAPPRASPLAMVKRMRAVFAEHEPDVVCTYNWGSIESVMAARSRRIPVLHHEDGFLPDEAASFKRRRVWTRRLVLRGARAVVVPSHRLEEIALRTWRLPRGLVRWIPNGIRIPDAPSDGERRAARGDFAIPLDAFVVGGVGHLRGEKNYGRLIDAFALLSAEVDEPERLRLLILGDGAERAGLVERASQGDVAGRVLLPGHKEDLAPAYRAMDVFAISSDTEQMPISLLEAMAAGLPAVSTDVGDIRIMLPEAQSPFVVPAEDGATALAQALETLRTSPELRRGLGEENRVRARERYAYEAMVDAYREIYFAAASNS